MDKKAYPFKVLDDGYVFEFESISQQKVVKKIVEFSEFEDVENLFNLALFDVSDDGSFSDISVSDNGDMENILSTVIQTIQVFLALHPKAKVLFMGSTKSRNRLYRAVIAKYFHATERIYEIHGISDWQNEPFQKNKDYDAFMIFLKIPNN
jgi:hypothetical protein